MSLTIKNLSDGSSQSVATGGLAFITLQAGDPNVANGSESRGLLAQWNTSVWTLRVVGSTEFTYPEQATAFVSGALTAFVSPFDVPQGDFVVSGDGDYKHMTPSAFIYLSIPKPGVYYVTVTVTGNSGVEYCGLIVQVLPIFNLPLCPALSWVPANLVDLQVDVGARTVNSAVLSHCAGLKQGDDFSLAVVPRLAGSLITSGITAMSLTFIDRANSPYAPLSFAATGSPPSLTEIGGDATHQYYTITGNLRSAQIASWFADLNRRVDALAAAQNNGQPIPDRTRLEALAQLHITTADGITTTQNFPFPILATAEVIATVGVGASTADAGIDLQWDLATNMVTAPGAVPAAGGTPAADAPILNVKEQDDLIARLRLVKGGSALAPTVTACKLVLKELEPDAQIATSDTSFATTGTGANFSVLLHMKLNGAKLAGALSNYEADAGTSFQALAEIELTFDNPFSVGPGSLVRTSKTFRIQIDRDLGEAA